MPREILRDIWRKDRITHNLRRILNLTTIGLLAVISGFGSLGEPRNITSSVTIPVEVQVVITTEKVPETLTTEEKVEQYFVDIPIMIEIARCESRYKHFNKDGGVNRGVLTPADVGVMQINEKYHLRDARKLGYDIHSLEGNMAYARYLYEREGARPWLSSSYCWAKYREIAQR